MPREENLLILKMLQEGTITAEQAAELLAALDSPGSRAAPPTPPTPPTPPSPPTPPVPPTPEVEDLGDGGETFARARAKIAQARETVAGMQERLQGAHDRLDKAEGSSQQPWQAVADALKDVPGARSISDALRGVDPARIAATARRQARRVARQVRSSLGDIEQGLNSTFSGEGRSAPTLSEERSANASVPAGGTLRVRNTLGDIEAVGSDGEQAVVSGTVRVWAANDAEARALADQVTLSVEQHTDGPTLSVGHPSKFKNAQIDLTVQVPHNIKVSLLSPAGDIAARDIRGGVVLATQSGDVEAREIAGDVAAETVSGDINIGAVVGNVTVSSASGDMTLGRVSGQALKALTQSGDISVRETTAQSVDAETVSGDVIAQGISGRAFRVRTVSGDVRAVEIAAGDEILLDTVSGCLELSPRNPMSGTATLGAVSGDVSLRLPTGANAQVSVSTRSGDVRGRWHLPDGSEQKVDASGMISVSETLGEGGAPVAISTVSGDIEFTQERAAAAPGV